MTTRRRAFALVAALAGAAGVCAIARQDQQGELGYDDTPMLPHAPYRVHDGTRPQPPVVDPGSAPGEPPSDAVVLFDGRDLSAWQAPGGGEPGWRVEDGELVIDPGSGAIETREHFGDCQVHLEFATPSPPEGTGQDRGNSGVMFFGRYEIQILDSYENLTYPDGQAAAIYGQHPPMVNASRPPGEWQTYDIVFLAPEFREDGTVAEPAHVTMFHNGVLVHHHTAPIGAVAFRAVGRYRPHGPEGPILLQDHGHPVRFRNIWARPVPGGDQPAGAAR